MATVRIQKGSRHVYENKLRACSVHYGSPGGPHSDFVFIFHFSIPSFCFSVEISVFIFYFSVLVSNFFIFTDLFRLTIQFCFDFSIFVFFPFIFSFCFGF